MCSPNELGLPQSTDIALLQGSALVTAKTSAQIGALAAHDFRHIVAACCRQISPAALLTGTELQDSSGFDSDRTIHPDSNSVDDGRKIGADDGNQSIGQKLQGRAGHRDFESRFIFLVADQDISKAQGQDIHGTRNINTVFLIADAANVLQTAQESWT